MLARVVSLLGPRDLSTVPASGDLLTTLLNLLVSAAGRLAVTMFVVRWNAWRLIVDVHRQVRGLPRATVTVRLRDGSYYYARKLVRKGENILCIAYPERSISQEVQTRWLARAEQALREQERQRFDHVLWGLEYSYSRIGRIVRRVYFLAHSFRGKKDPLKGLTVDISDLLNRVVIPRHAISSIFITAASLDPEHLAEL